ncbi:MAG: NAD(P)H-dependent glycerol-3-phosphate dehydrogenase [Thermodesulfobacteriota bacterium]
MKIGVIGAGSWGTALADLLARKGLNTTLWVYEPEVHAQIEAERENGVFLPGVKLSENLRSSSDLTCVASGKDLLVMVVPSHLVRDISGSMAGEVSPETLIVSASKGIENKTHLTMSAVLRETLAHVPARQITVLSGPSFAKEVARKVPTLVTVAGEDLETAGRIQHIFATAYFRVYTNNDMIGVELGGAVKNVIAIASGIVDGLGLGLNTRAALITRGLSEISRLGMKMGANPHTFAGLAGVGDLMLTCTGDLSRNHTVGKQIGAGKTLSAILDEMRMVAEGVRTAKSVYNLSRKLGVEMPISHQVYHVLYENLSPAEAVHRLMTRDLRHELDDYGIV